MYHETHARSVLKAVSWRVLGTIATSTLVFIFTRRFALSLAVGAMEFVSKIGLFWLHERAWDRVRVGRRQAQSAVLWFTGLSGSGKSTLSAWVVAELRRRGFQVEHLDGDTVRDIFPRTGYTRSERDEHIRRVGYLASKLEQNGVLVVASFVSPYAESRQFVRNLCRNFIEIHIATPLEECERRDVKGLYARARAGEIENFTGISDPYEEPLQPELRIDASAIRTEEAGARVLEVLRRSPAGSGSLVRVRRPALQWRALSWTRPS
jgi:adenylylsulfate kinase